jgi:hypothetical protein
MSMDRDVNVNLKVTPDPLLAQKIQQTTGAIDAELDKLARNDALRKLANDAADLAKKTGDAKAAAQQLATGLAKVGATQQEAQMAGGQFARNVTAQPGSGAGVSASRGASALGAAGGLIGSAGGSAGVGQAANAMSLLGGNIAALGPIGVVTAGAAIGLSVAMKALNEASEKAREGIIRHNELVRDQLELEYMTTDELTKTVEARQREVDMLKEQIAQAATVEEPTELRDAAIKDNLFVIGDALGLVGAAGDQAATDLSEMEEKLATAEGELVNVNEALGSTEVAANDAAKAMEDLAKQMSKDLLNSADDAGESVRELTAAQNRSRESNNDRLKQIAAEQKALQASLGVLQSQEDSTGEAAKQIEILNAKMADLSREAGTVSQVMSQQASAQREVAKETHRTTTAAGFLGRKRSKEEKDEQQKTMDDLLKTAIDYHNKIADIEFDAAKSREKIAIDANREQERLIRESKQQFDQDFYQDFLGEFQRRQELAFNLKETQIGAGQSFADVGRDAFNAQQQARAEQQQAISNVFNISGDTQSIMRTLQQAGVV